MILFAKQKIRDTDIENKCVDTKGESRGGVGGIGRLGLIHLLY